MPVGYTQKQLDEAVDRLKTVQSITPWPGLATIAPEDYDMLVWVVAGVLGGPYHTTEETETEADLHRIADTGWPTFVVGKDYPDSGDDEYKPILAYEREAIDGFIETIVEEGYRKVAR